ANRRSAGFSPTGCAPWGRASSPAMTPAAPNSVSNCATSCSTIAVRWRCAPCHAPGGTELAQQLRDILLHYRGKMALPTEALLFMASRAQLVTEVIKPALDAGSVVIVDRFLLSTVVYQGHAGGLDPNEIWRVGLFGTGGLEPDLTLVLDLPLEVSL